MRFSALAFLSLSGLSAALPTPNERALKTRQAGPLLADTTYDAISISGGQAGNAEQEALDVFSVLDLNNPENIDPADIEFLGAVNDVANDAETDAFNPAIEAATGEEATALQNGKIKNKVLKLMATKIELEAKQAQGEDVAAKLEEELTKLNNNIALDQEAAGQASTAVSFDATISGGGNVGAVNNNVADSAAVQDEVATEDNAGTEQDADAAEEGTEAQNDEDTETANEEEEDGSDNEDEDE